MSHILFINPSVDKFTDTKIWASGLMDYINGEKTAMPKLVAMLLAAITPEKHTFTHIDEEVEDIDFDLPNIDLVALTAMTIQADRAYAIAAEFKKRGVKVALGGIHASVLPDEAAMHVDTVFIGEGENTWLPMLEDLERGQLKSLYNAKDYPPVTELISPRVDVIKHERYSMFPIMATKGCPYSCDFCSIQYSSGNKIRMKPVEQVVEEIQAFEKYNTGPIKKRYQFVDDNLYINPKYTKKLFIALRQLGITWQGQGTLNTLKDDVTLRLMAESGCRSFSIGFESISEESLKEVNKTGTNHVEDYDEGIKKLIQHGIAPSGFFIFGFDSDDVTVFEKTVNYIKNSHIICPFFNILTPYPGTRVYDRVKERITDHKWSHYTSIHSVYTPAKMTSEQLESGMHWASYEVASLDTLKKQFEYFWSQGPWEKNPRLTLSERMILLLVALKLGRHKAYKGYKKFLFWVATRKKAVDLYTIFAGIVFNQKTREFFKDAKNPAQD